MIYAIIVAGGIGSRMNISTPKQFVLIHEKPIIYYSIHLFQQSFPNVQIIIVLPKAHIQDAKILLSKYINIDQIQFIIGGETRFQSVKNGLEQINEEGIVFIHDAVRPCIHNDFLQKLYLEAVQFGNAIPCIDVKDSIRIVDHSGNKPIDRNQLKAIQTPQVFDIKKIQGAYHQAYKESFTDDASVLESTGLSIHLVEGLEENIKITKPNDLDIAEIYLKKMQ